MGDELKKVFIDPKQLKESNVEQAERDIEVPELNKLMGLGEGEVAVVKIRQLDLNEYLSAQQQNVDLMRNLVEGVVAAAEKRGEVTDEVLAAYRGLSAPAKYYVEICQKGVVEPVLKRPEWIFLAKRFPITIENIASSILVLTRGGANLKKNS